MRDRIRQIMEYEHLTPSEFADKLQIGRAVMSHILNGRNNPSLEVVSRILSSISYISPEWLINGIGQMKKTDSTKVGTDNATANIFQQSEQPDLFSQTDINKPQPNDVREYRKENIVETPESKDINTVVQNVIYQKTPERKVVKIIIYYSDSTFETFNADTKPL